MRTEHYKRVREFMVKAGQDTPDETTAIPDEVRILRAKLILEEAFETVNRGLGVSAGVAYCDLDFKIMGRLNLVELADGCADLSVVNIGTLIAAGIDDVELLEMIDESNLAKFTSRCPNCQRLYTEHDPAPDPDENFEVECPNCQLPFIPAHRREDGKWIKPTDWKAPDIESLL
jgi:hypothetical protein